jgi:hypothetical protein
MWALTQSPRNARECRRAWAFLLVLRKASSMPFGALSARQALKNYEAGRLEGR